VVLRETLNCTSPPFPLPFFVQSFHPALSCGAFPPSLPEVIDALLDPVFGSPRLFGSPWMFAPPFPSCNIALLLGRRQMGPSSPLLPRRANSCFRPPTQHCLPPDVQGCPLGLSPLPLFDPPLVFLTLYSPTHFVFIFSLTGSTICWANVSRSLDPSFVCPQVLLRSSPPFCNSRVFKST